MRIIIITASIKCNKSILVFKMINKIYFSERSYINYCKLAFDKKNSRFLNINSILTRDNYEHRDLYSLF